MATENKEISALGFSAINSTLFNPHMSERTKKRLAMQLLTEAEVYCNRLIDKWFRFVSKNKDDIEGYARLLKEQDRLWRNYIRARSDKYDYSVCAHIFIQKMNFLIGGKKEVAAEIESIKDSEK